MHMEGSEEDARDGRGSSSIQKETIIDDVGRIAQMGHCLDVSVIELYARDHHRMVTEWQRKTIPYSALEFLPHGRVSHRGFSLPTGLLLDLRIRFMRMLR